MKVLQILTVTRNAVKIYIIKLSKQLGDKCLGGIKREIYTPSRYVECLACVPVDV